MKKFLILNLCVFGILSSVHAERVYKWCDAKGLTHYATFVPAVVDAEVIHFPLSTSPTVRSKEVYSSHFHQQHFRSKRKTYFIQVAGHDEERAGREYNRKYGAVACKRKFSKSLLIKYYYRTACTKIAVIIACY